MIFLRLFSNSQKKFKKIFRNRSINKNRIILFILFILLFILFTTQLGQKIIFQPQQYIVLKCIIPNPEDQGGFAWHLHHAQVLFYLCQLTGKKPLIYYNTGYYYSAKYGSNWWNYYFKPIQSQWITNRLIQYGEKYGYHPIRTLSLDKNNTYLPYLYDNTTFQTLIKNKINIEWSDMYQYIQLNSRMEYKINQFVQQHFNYPVMIGIHYRGTDKFAAYQDNEDLEENKHPEYETVIKTIQKYIKSNKISEKYGLFVASDEQPFINIMYKNFSNISSYQSIRSNINTSGLKLDIPKTNNTPKQLRKIQLQSVHRGHSHICPHKKGEDAVMDLWLLSRCHIYFKSLGGNFSSQPKRINPKLIVYKVSS